MGNASRQFGESVLVRGLIRQKVRVLSYGSGIRPEQSILHLYRVPRPDRALKKRVVETSIGSEVRHTNPLMPGCICIIGTRQAKGILMLGLVSIWRPQRSAA
jgi:hypothetical protein